MTFQVSAQGSDQPTAWILADHGKIGTYSQCLGIAQALGVTPVFKSIKARLPWRVLPPQLWIGALHAQTPGHDPLTPPWPDLLIAAGRLSVAPALSIQKLNKKCFTIILQKPYLHPRHFGCVVAPCHDHLTGPNVISVLGALHRLSAQEINAAAQAWPRPEKGTLTTVLLGGGQSPLPLPRTGYKGFGASVKKDRGALPH